MATEINIYMDSVPLINLAKFKLRGKLTQKEADDALQTQLLLEASRDGALTIHTSFLTVAECTHIGNRKEVSDEAKEFYDELLTSNEGGIHLLQTTVVLINQARNLSWDHSVNLRGADLIHVATALFAKCTEFITGDGKISKQAAKLKAMGLTIVKPGHSKQLPAEYSQIGLDLPQVEEEPSPAKATRVLTEKGERRQ